MAFDSESWSNENAGFFGAKPIPARTPRLKRNPAAAAVSVALGG